MKKFVALAAGVLVALGLAAGGALYVAHWIDSTPPTPPNYADDAAWLCRPGRPDACAAPTTATIFEPDGGKRVATYAPDPAAPIDCFYLYPTVSTAKTAYAPIELTTAETNVARRQLARFSTVCRTYAPLYRQVTVAGLPSLFHARNGVSLAVPDADVLAAWTSYLAKDNQGRGVVLIGHSQGSRLLVRLIKREIDGKPSAARLVSAILPGAEIDVPTGQAVGGSFKQVPLCGSGTQAGCVIGYSSFPADQPIPADARFGATQEPDRRDACVDPMKLAGAPYLDADLPLSGDLKSKYGTDFAELPGLLSAACKDDGRFSVLAISASPKSPAGEKTAAMIERLAQYSPTSGLHSLDINLALGTLVDLVRKQTATYLRH